MISYKYLFLTIELPDINSSKSTLFFIFYFLSKKCEKRGNYEGTIHKAKVL